MVFQFEHTGAGKDAHNRYGKWDSDKMPLPEWKATLSKWQTGLAGKAWNSLYLSNHDQPRSVSRYGNDSEEYREVSAKMLATCLHMMQGTPYVYQGEELGMTNVYFDKQFVITVYNHFILVAQTDQFLIIRKYGIRITNLLLRVNL